MIYRHKKTGQALQLESDHGDMATCFLLDENLNKIRIYGFDCSQIWETVICSKENLVEVLI